jgi:ligand-binding sensor domain-containing protein/signal transduction histidine kinase
MRLLSVVLIILSSTQSARAIDPNRTISQYVREHWGTESGFPKGPVYSINQTPDGYLWIGTEKGLVRFDGLTFQLMEPASQARYSLNHILGLITDREGSLWVRLLRPGLLRYRNGVFEEVMEKLGRPRSTVTAMTRGSNGSLLLWVLQGEAQAIELRNGKFETLAAPVEFSRSPVLALAQMANGDIWVGTRDAGLFRVSEGKITPIIRGLPDLKVNALAPAGDKELWIATDRGIVRWDGSQLTRSRVPPSLDGVQALAMTIDRDSNLWVGTNSRGLVRVNAQGNVSLEESDQAAKEAVTAVFEDREGNLWAGSASGLEKFRDSAFISWSAPEGVRSEGTNPVFADAEGRVWFAPVNGGVAWLKDSQHGQVTAAGLGRDIVYSIAGNGRELWVGRQHGGLTQLRFERGAIAAKTWTHSDGLAQDSVYSVSLSRDGSVWAGTLSGGVSRLHAGRFTNYTIANGFASNTITAILETSDGKMWFATPAGLTTSSNNSWKTYTTNDGLPSADVNCLLEDPSGVLWVGTSAGLAFRSSDRFQVPAGIPASLREQVLGLGADGFGSLWISTANRILRVTREKLLRGALAGGDIREYGLADGLRGVEGVKRHRSVVTDTAGRIWFSLNRGISVVDPGRLKNNAAPAIVHVQSILADGNLVPLERAAHIPGGRHRITFNYTGLSLSVPDRVRFRYQLDGFDRDWSEPVAIREAVYTNLGPGSYRFRVIASNPDGLWSPAEAAMAFEVDPLVWQTWWFRAGIVLTVMIAGLALYRLRLHQVTRRMNVRFEERLAERTRIAQELHDTLLQGFLSASMQVHVAADRLPEESQAKPILTRALQLMGQVIEEGRNAVRGLRSSNSPSLDLEHAFARIQQELVPQTEGSEEVGFRVIVEGQRRPLHPLLRDEVYRIGREALINAFRHSRAKKVELELKYSPNQLRIVVRDDGRGIDPQILKSGRDGHWGLSGMRERADRIGARLHLWSSANAGTEIELAVPGKVAFQNYRNRNGWPGKYFQRTAETKPRQNGVGTGT